MGKSGAEIIGTLIGLLAVVAISAYILQVGWNLIRIEHIDYYQALGAQIVLVCIGSAINFSRVRK
jgi:hypothetical protein